MFNFNSATWLSGYSAGQYSLDNTSVFPLFLSQLDQKAGGDFL